MNDSKNRQIEWSAFCYVAEEMTTSEREQFEQRLAVDQSAREALAQAVELTQAVAAAEADWTETKITPASLNGSQRPEKSWPRRLAWMAIGSAASLLVALLWSSSGAGTYVASLWHEPAVALELQSDQLTSLPQLAAAWTQTREELSDANDAALWYPAHLAASGWSSDGSPFDSGSDDSFEESANLEPRFNQTGDEAFNAPSWMTAAVSGLAAKVEPAESDSPSNVPKPDLRGDDAVGDDPASDKQTSAREEI